jgi:Zn-dependent peptidase ImmA (M78 family)/DNA-binding XRE family transcriptional regulator
MSYESINVGVLAERLVAARKAAKITQEAAADFLGMSRPTFIAIEKASRRPHPEELIKLAQIYKVPLNRLVRNDAAPQIARPHLRAALGASSEGEEGLDDAISRLSSYIDDYQQLEKLGGSAPGFHFPPEVRIPPGPIEKFAEHCAQEERARLNLGAHQPIDLLRKVLEEAGLHVFCDVLDSKLSGLYVFVPAFGYCILVNRLHPRERRRWTIAHEYGHFLAARETPGVDYAKPKERKPIGEKFADSFAAAFLMPESGIQRRFYDAVDRTGDFKTGDLLHMANYYAVSPMAIALRLEALGLIQRGTWNEIQQSGVPVGKLRREAGVEAIDDNDSVDRYPERYKLLAARAFEDGKISEGQLADFLRCSRVEAREIVDKYSRARIDGEERSLPISQSLLAGAAAG